MPLLTIDIIRENPWNVTTHTLPPRPSLVLFELALFAAAYCRDSENLLMRATRAGDCVPTGWDSDCDVQPDIHEESEDRSWEADVALSEILGCYDDEV